MVSKEELHRRIVETKYDIFPIGKMLPLASVHHFIVEEYKKAPEEAGFHERKYQRLREGYFALFVAAALSKGPGGEHYMRFPLHNDNDVDILSVNDLKSPRPKFWKLICDVKEFTPHSQSFVDFVEKAVKPKLKAGAYHIIIGMEADAPGSLLKNLSILSKKTATVWVVSSPSPSNQSYNKMLVTRLQGESAIYQEEIDLLKDVPLTGEPPIVFQDDLRDILT
jgi:hypothetical protein